MSSLYHHNPLIHRDRRLGESDSAWVRSFAAKDLRPLVVCRGPIRLEAIQIFHEMGIEHVGILLSEKDSIVYPHALAPELRIVPMKRVHRVPDYTGATKEERQERTEQIIAIAKEHGYSGIFAGYGFMAEDVDFVATIERAGLTFMGPCSRTQRAAGKKDEAKRTALAEEVSVTPGVDDLTTRLLVKKATTLDALKKLAKEQSLDVADADGSDLSAFAAAVLSASYDKGIDLFSIEELSAQVEEEVYQLFLAHPDKRVRLKAIGGGGGKGQRILAAPKPGPEPIEQRARAAARTAFDKAGEVLSEVKATGVGDNKNMLLELNIEQTRHNEIQLLGNGEWCVALGGRDCSLQMHEQKLLEVSVTREGLDAAIADFVARGQHRQADVLRADKQTLIRMEEEGERFGRAVGLDSASTFECIVDGDRHYFMEVNTRIQVEHRVTELCYKLRFENPSDPIDAFEVESLVEAMALVAEHGPRLPKPKLIMRHGAAVEARLNATDDALAPHAGGTIMSWSDPIEGEVRDDQGICIKNPDTSMFMKYRLAGAYDSNIALLVTCGDSRAASYDKLADILRITKIRGDQLATNLAFHYGLLNWFRGYGVWAKPSTRFVEPYLAAVGLLKQAAADIDLDLAARELARAATTRIGENVDAAQAKKAVTEIFERKATLVRRPVELLLANPHVLSGWLALYRDFFQLEGDRGLFWRGNPVELLRRTYQYLNMESGRGAPPAHVIWEHDEALLDEALAFYGSLPDKIGLPDDDFAAMNERLRQAEPPSGVAPELWTKVRSAHAGHQLGLGLLALPVLIASKTGFFELTVKEDLTCAIPERLTDPDLITAMRKVLSPPPATKADEIVAVTGGMFYSQEGPGKPPFVQVGDHFEAGQPLYIIEVMKMFNRVGAPFAGTVEQELIPNGNGVIVQKGQPLFKVKPDEMVVEVDPEERARARAATTRELLSKLTG